MKIEIKIPEVGESVQEALLTQWYKKDGDTVRKDDILFVIETDKVTLEVVAEADGVLKILVPEGETLAVGGVVGTLETEPAGKAVETPVAFDAGGAKQERKESARLPVEGVEAAEAEAELPPMPLAPAVRRLVAENRLDVSNIQGSGPGGRITKGDVLLHLEQTAREKPQARVAKPAEETGVPTSRSVVELPAERAEQTPPQAVLSEEVTRKPMSRIRRRIAERLLAARQNTAMLTTFNEIDMRRVQALRSRFKQAFHERYQVSLGIMSFFIKAAIEALKDFPEINAFIDGKDIVYHHYYHIGVAIGGEKGLLVPVIRHADRLSFAQLEQAILDYVGKIKDNRVEIADLEGGTFTISNGGVYGSLLSTPILNTPQSGILGMHKIEDRPIAAEGQVVIRPMMYVALSYDHRIVDGREAVSFLKRIKECIENPERMMLEI